MKRTSKSFRFVVALALVISLSFPISFNAFALTDGDGDGTSTSSIEQITNSEGSANPETTSGGAAGTTNPAITSGGAAEAAPSTTSGGTSVEEPSVIDDLDSSEFSGDFDSLPDSIKAAVNDMESTADPAATDNAATLAAPELPKLKIDSVEVVNGGDVQIKHRDTITYDKKLDSYFTSKRSASMTDARIFTVYSIFYPNQLGMRDFSKFDISKINWTYGEKAFSEWKQYAYVEEEDGNIDEGFIGDQAISVLSQKNYTDGRVMVVVAQIEFDEFYPEGWYSVNIPYEGYTAMKKQGFSTFAEDNQDILGPHDLDMIYQDQSESNATTDAKPTTGTIASTSIDLNLYDSFHTWQEICQFAEDLGNTSSKNDKIINDRYVSVQTLDTSKTGRDIYNIVIAEDVEAVDQYLDDTKPSMETAEGIEAIKAQLNEDQLKGTEIEYNGPKIPIYFNNVHPDETPASDAIIELINTFIYEKNLSYETQTDWVHHDKTPGGYDGYTSEGPKNETSTKSFTVDEILDHFILVFNITENPDGKDNLLRANDYGFDLNRDAAYQTQKESTALTTDLVKWDPMAMLEYHGYVDELLIEPCTGPHDPNYEYDLYAAKMLAQGNELGRAMIGNTAYSQYLVPATDYSDSWDDGAPVYGPMFAMLYGVMGYTLEIPYTTEDSKDACYSAGLALIYDCLNNFNSYYENRLTYKLRGIHNIDSPEVDKLLIDPYTGEQVGRPRTAGHNFFPEYYVIPIDNTNQKNPLEAYKALAFLMRNGAKITQTTGEVKYGDAMLPAGTFVIDMNQASRGFINSMLSDGYDASSFLDIYAEIVISYPDMRNFDCITVWEDNYFTDKTTKVDEKIVAPSTSIGGLEPPSGIAESTIEEDLVVIYNNNIDVIKLVNKLLDEDRKVQILTLGDNKGDFVISRTDLNDFCSGLLVYGAPFTGSLDNAETLVEPNITILGSEAHSKYILDLLGFTGDYAYAKKVSEIAKDNTDVLVGFNNGSDVSSLVSGSGIGFIGIGTSTLNAANNYGILPGLSCYIPKSRTTETYREGLIESYYSDQSLVTANYDQTDAAYVMNGTYITKAPFDGEALITVSSDSDFFKAGWYPNHDVLKGEMLAVSGFSGSNHDVPVTLFANNIFSKAHAQHTFNMFANAVFLTALDYGTDKPLIEASPSSQETLTSSLNVALTFSAYREGITTFADGNELTQSKYKITGSEAEVPYKAGNGWLDYTSTTSITLASSGTFYIHAYAENSLGESVQRAFGPYNIGTTGGSSSGGHSHSSGSSSTPATTTKAAITTTPSAFTDISGHWAKASIEYVVGKKLFSGISDTLFGPDNTMTKGMLVTVLGRAKGIDPTTYSNGTVFTDVPQSAYYAPYVAWAYESKIISGSGNGLFEPDKPVTRGEMSVIITNYMKYIGKGTAGTANLSYADAAQIDSWGLEGVQFVTANGLMTGTAGNNFDFDGLSTRAQVATVLERLMKLIGQ